MKMNLCSFHKTEVHFIPQSLQRCVVELELSLREL